MTHIPLDKAKLAAFCRRHPIRRLAFFDSVLNTPGFLSHCLRDQVLAEAEDQYLTAR